LISADYEFMLRYLIKEKRKAVFIDEVMVTMRAGGVSNRSVAGILRANWECYRAWKNNGLSAPVSLLVKPLSKWWGA